MKNKKIIIFLYLFLSIFLISANDTFAASCTGTCRLSEEGIANPCQSGETLNKSMTCDGLGYSCCTGTSTTTPVFTCTGTCRYAAEGGSNHCEDGETMDTSLTCSGVGAFCCTGGSTATSKINNCPGTCRLALDTSSGCNSNEDVNMSYTCGANTNMKCCITKSSAAATSAPYTSASGSGGGGASLTFPPPTTHTTFQSLLTAVAVALKNLVVVAAILFIVVGGLMYIMSSGNETMIKRAKACIAGALIGLAIVVAGPSFLKEIQTILGTSVSSELSSQPSIATIGARILSFILSIFGIIAIIFLVWGGTNYLTAYGNEKKIQDAKSMVAYSIIGIVIALSALVVVQQVIDLLS